MPRDTSGNRSDKRGHRTPTYWRGSIGKEARAALSIMALQDAVAQRIEQDEAEALLLQRLILEEKQRRLA